MTIEDLTSLQPGAIVKVPPSPSGSLGDEKRTAIVRSVKRLGAFVSFRTAGSRPMENDFETSEEFFLAGAMALCRA